MFHNRIACILIIYGPYHHRQEFWDKVMESSILNYLFLIVANDLKFTLPASNDLIEWEQKLKSKNRSDLFFVEAELNEFYVDENIFH